MAKRPSLLANIDMEAGQGASPEAAKVVKMPKQAVPVADKAKSVKSSLYLPPQAHRKLKEIAFAKECKVHDLVVQGLDRVLKDNGYPSVAELSKS